MRYSTSRRFYAPAGGIVRNCTVLGLVLLAVGLAIGLVVAPTDSEQGDAYRIVFVHAPAAWMSMLMFAVMAFWAALGLLLQTPLSLMTVRALAPTGALMTFVALWTGSLWGKPVWGTWWTWDARLSAELTLMALYLGFLALQAVVADETRADKAGAVLALVGVVQVPVVYYSVHRWQAPNPGVSVDTLLAPALSGPVLVGLLVMVAAFWTLCIAASMHRLRSIILERERGAGWVRKLGEVGS